MSRLILTTEKRVQDVDLNNTRHVYSFKSNIFIDAGDKVYVYDTLSNRFIHEQQLNGIELYIKDDTRSYIFSENEITITDIHERKIHLDVPLSKNSKICTSGSDIYVVDDGIIYQFVGDKLLEIFKNKNIVHPNEIIPSDDNYIHFSGISFDTRINDITANEFDGSEAVAHTTTHRIDNDEYHIFGITSQGLVYQFNTDALEVQTKPIFGRGNFQHVLSANELEEFKYTTRVKSINNRIYIVCSMKGLTEVYDITSDNNPKKVLSVKHSKKSFSKNVSYNHSIPIIEMLSNDICLVGSDGTYTDTPNVIDNSIFMDDKIIMLSIDKQIPITCSGEECVNFIDTVTNTIHRVFLNDVSEINGILPESSTANSARMFDNLIILYDSLPESKSTLVDIINIRDNSNYRYSLSNDHELLKTDVNKHLIVGCFIQDGFITICYKSHYSSNTWIENTGIACNDLQSISSLTLSDDSSVYLILDGIDNKHLHKVYFNG